MIPYGRQEITNEDIQNVIDVLKSNFLTQGPAITAFEEKFAKYCGAKYAVAVSSCTGALHISCLALDLGKDDIFWSVPNTFVASANCGLYCGGKVDLVDIDPDTWNISIPALREKLTLADKNGTLPKILIPVHFSGQACDMAEIKALSEQYGFRIIEDAAHAIGASYNDKKIGNCQYSDIAVFSTHPVKIITTGEGGLITTNDTEIYKRLLRLRTHGITRDPSEMKNSPDGAWYFEQIELGYNYRMTDIQAALGISQMDRIDTYVQKRRELAKRYTERLSALPLQLPSGSNLQGSSWHLYVIRLQLNNIAKSQNEIFEDMREAGIGVNIHYIPVHFHPYYRNLGFNKGDFPQSETYYQEAITLPLHPQLTNKEQYYICDTLESLIK